MAYEAWTVEVEYESDVWTDVTSRVDTASNPFSVLSGDTPESSTDTGGFTLPLQNHDQAFTPGNALSALALRAGLRVRVRENVNGQLFHRGFGYTAYPEIQAWTQSNADTPRTQLLVLPVIDRAAWIAQGRNMISTLGEHIIHHGGAALVAYWPMNETEGPDVYPAVGGPWTLRQTKRIMGSGNAPFATHPTISFGSSGTAPADDLSSVEFDPAYAVDPLTEYDATLLLVGDRPTPLTLDTGQVLTFVCWMRPTEVIPAANAAIPIILENSANSNITAEIGMSSGGSGLFNAFGANEANWFGFVEFGPPILVDQPIPVAIRLGFDPDVIELWVRGETYTETMTINTPTAAVFDRIVLGLNFPGALNHVQIYLGAEDDWTHDDFLAQWEMGLLGLERQTTGERIRTVLEYAGVDPADLGRIDNGASLMQVARLAGRNAMNVVADAVSTEQGEFYADGAGQFVFADRRTLYNV